MSTQPEPQQVAMTERELAFFKAGRSLGQADAYAEVAKHHKQNASVAAVQQWSAQMATWMQALAKDVAALRGVGGQRGKKNSGAELSRAVVAAMPSLNQPQAAIEQFLSSSSSAFAAKADQAKAQFAAHVAAADQAGGRPQGVVRRLIGALAAELERMR